MFQSASPPSHMPPLSPMRGSGLAGVAEGRGEGGGAGPPVDDAHDASATRAVASRDERTNDGPVAMSESGVGDEGAKSEKRVIGNCWHRAAGTRASAACGPPRYSDRR